MNSLIKNKRKKYISRQEFFSIIDEITSNKTVRQMKLYTQHGNTSCYTHCLSVAYYSYFIAKKFGLDYRSTARAAMLHDLFLYDWHNEHSDPEFTSPHAFSHPKIALRNALQLFELNRIEQDIIKKHMWPVTISLPKYKETYIVTLMDKYSAIRETYIYFQSQLKRNKLYKYAYIFLGFLLFRIID